MTARKVNPMPKAEICRLGGLAAQRLGKGRRFNSETGRAAQLLAPVMSQEDGKRYGKMGGRPRKKQ